MSGDSGNGTSGGEVTGGADGAGSSGTTQSEGSIVLPSNGYTLGPSDYWIITVGGVRAVVKSGVRPLVPVLINGRIVYYAPPPLIRELNKLLPDGVVAQVGLILSIAPRQIEDALNGATWNVHVADGLVDTGGFAVGTLGLEGGLVVGGVAAAAMGAPVIAPIVAVVGAVALTASYYNYVAATNLRTNMAEWVAQPLGPTTGGAYLSVQPSANQPPIAVPLPPVGTPTAP